MSGITVYALYAGLRPAVPLSWPIPPVDLVLLCVLVASGDRARAARWSVAFCCLDALLATPLPWFRWLLRFGLLGVRDSRVPPVLAAVALVLLWQTLIVGNLDLWQLLFSALLARAAVPPASSSGRPPGWGWHARPS